MCIRAIDASSNAGPPSPPAAVRPPQPKGVVQGAFGGPSPEGGAIGGSLVAAVCGGTVVTLVVVALVAAWCCHRPHFTNRRRRAGSALVPRSTRVTVQGDNEHEKSSILLGDSDESIFLKDEMTEKVSVVALTDEKGLNPKQVIKRGSVVFDSAGWPLVSRSGIGKLTDKLRRGNHLTNDRQNNTSDVPRTSSSPDISNNSGYIENDNDSKLSTSIPDVTRVEPQRNIHLEQNENLVNDSTEASPSVSQSMLENQMGYMSLDYNLKNKTGKNYPYHSIKQADDKLMTENDVSNEKVQKCH